MSLCAKSVENTSEFNSDISSTDDHNLLWLFFDIKESVGIDTILGSRDIVFRRDSRSTTYSDHDLLRSNFVLASVVLGDFNSVGIDEFSPSLVVVYILLVEVGFAS
jgi:hypothetical protein